MKLKGQLSHYKQLFFRREKDCALLSVTRQMVGRCNRTRRSAPGAGWTGVLFLALGVLSSTLSAVEPTIHGAWLGPEVTYGEGDTWWATWADDGDLYVTSDDSSGIGGNCYSKSRKASGVWVVVNRLQGDDPAHLKGETVNCMEAYDGPLDPKSQAHHPPYLEDLWNIFRR